MAPEVQHGSGLKEGTLTGSLDQSGVLRMMQDLQDKEGGFPDPPKALPVLSFLYPLFLEDCFHPTSATHLDSS